MHRKGTAVRVAIFAAAAAAFVAFPSFAAGKAAARVKGCPSQECAFGPWRARAEVPVYTSQDVTSPVVFTAGKGDTVTGMSAELVVSRMGQCLTTKPIQAYETGSKSPVPMKARERISALYYSGDGYVVGTYGRKRIEACCVGDDLNCKTEPASEQWLKVKSATGAIGWTNQRDKFSGTTE